MLRRGCEDAKQVIAMLRARGLLGNWELVALDGLTHNEVAKQLRMSRIFLAFTDQEGFGLPAAEAMACGNYVIGNHGYGGREFFKPAFSGPVEHGDVMGFVRAIEKAFGYEDRDDSWCLRKGRQASDFILSEYPPRREHDEVVQTYTEMYFKHLPFFRSSDPRMGFIPS
jgi:glycosyltransferase involved in cell wall biosynthesis